MDIGTRKKRRADTAATPREPGLPNSIPWAEGCQRLARKEITGRFFTRERATTDNTSRQVTPIEDPEAHLTCYDIDLDAQIGISFLIGIETVNQFNHIPLEPLTLVTDERVLCVPSRKVFELGLPSSFKTP